MAYELLVISSIHVDSDDGYIWKQRSELFGVPLMDHNKFHVLERHMGSYAQYVTLSGTAAHLPIAFTTKLSNGNYSIYIGILASPTANVTLFHDTGHSQYLTFTPI